MAVCFCSSMSLLEWLACILMFAYGLRLGSYLLIRERKSAADRKELSPEIERSKKMPIAAKLGLWVGCALLYTLMTIPLFFRLKNRAQPDAMLWTGLAVAASGFVIEAAADLQKTLAKKKNSRRFVDSGLYRFVHCPNYFGELLLWLGRLITGINALHGFRQWLPALLGFALIAWVMFGGARRLELRQDKNYGTDPKYQEYVKSVPIMIPFVPLYSVKKCKFLAA